LSRFSDRLPFKSIEASSAHGVGMLNDRKNIFYDTRTRRAFFLQELSMKRRFFGKEHADDPVGEWVDAAAPQPMLQDVVILFEILSAAAKEHHHECHITATLYRTRRRTVIKRAADAKRSIAGHSNSVSYSPVRSSVGARAGTASPSTPRSSLRPCLTDRANQWEAQLAHSRLSLVASRLAEYGVPSSALQAKMVDGAQDSYYIQFEFHFRSPSGSGTHDVQLWGMPTSEA